MLNLADAHRVFLHNDFTWFRVSGLIVRVRILVDPLSVTKFLFITGVSAMIHLYMLGYMEGNPDYPSSSSI